MYNGFTPSAPVAVPQAGVNLNGNGQLAMLLNNLPGLINGLSGGPNPAQNSNSLDLGILASLLRQQGGPTTPAAGAGTPAAAAGMGVSTSPNANSGVSASPGGTSAAGTGNAVAMPQGGGGPSAAVMSAANQVLPQVPNFSTPFALGGLPGLPGASPGGAGAPNGMTGNSIQQLLQRLGLGMGGGMGNGFPRSFG